MGSREPSSPSDVWAESDGSGDITDAASASEMLRDKRISTAQRCALGVVFTMVISLWVVGGALLVVSGIALSDALDVMNNDLPGLVAELENITVLENDCLSCDTRTKTLTMEGPLRNDIPQPQGSEVQFRSGDLDIIETKFRYDYTDSANSGTQFGLDELVVDVTDGGALVFATCSTFNADCKGSNSTFYKASYGVGIFYTGATARAQRCPSDQGYSSIYQVAAGPPPPLNGTIIPYDYYICVCTFKQPPNMALNYFEFCQTTDMIADGLDWTA